MIRCKPKGICSWDFYLDGDGHHATLEFNWAGEQGSITADGLRFEVQRHGGFRGRWTLDDAGRETASAQQATTIIPTFEINDDNDSHVLCAECAFGRSFRLERSGDVIATVCTDHAFTRRATIDVRGQKLEFTIVSFAFWLVVLTWRRAANSSGSGNQLRQEVSKRIRLRDGEDRNQ